MMALGKCLGDISANHLWFCRLATGQWAFDTPRSSFGYVQDGRIVTAVLESIHLVYFFDPYRRAIVGRRTPTPFTYS